MTVGNRDRSALKVFVCGCPATGKSALIDRMADDAALTPEDGVAGVSGAGEAAPPSKTATDLPYRDIATSRRRFVVVETDGLESYSLDLISSASPVQAVVIVTDARSGLAAETRRAIFIAHMMGVPSVLLAVNKMDAVGFSGDACAGIVSEYRAFAGKLGIESASAVPVSALSGANVATPGSAMPWYEGPTLVGALEAISADSPRAAADFRMPVQSVSTRDGEMHGYQGTVVQGAIAKGEAVTVYPSPRPSRVTRLRAGGEDRERAQAGEAVSLELEDEITIRCGDVIACGKPLDVTDQFAAHLIWMDDRPLIPERRYSLRLGTARVGAAVTELKYRFNLDSLEHVAAKTLSLNEIAFCNFALDRPVAFEPVADNQMLGVFTLADPETGDTIGAGAIQFGLRRATNVYWQQVDLGKAELSAIKSQKPVVIWLTGLSGAGKSTIANSVQRRLHGMGKHTYLLDGDNLRHGINKDLGFVEADRVENIRRAAEVAKLFVDSGIIVLVSLISPFRSERRMARDLLEDDEFIEVFVDTPLEICEQRDPKGLYRKARSGNLVNFTGIDSPYERPENAEIVVDGGGLTAEAAADQIVEYLITRSQIDNR